MNRVNDLFILAKKPNVPDPGYCKRDFTRHCFLPTVIRNGSNRTIAMTIQKLPKK